VTDKLEAVAAFARVNSIDRHVIESPHAKVGIVTCGKAHYDLMEVLRRLEVTPESLARVGVRLYKVGLSFPVEQTRILAFAQGLVELVGDFTPPELLSIDGYSVKRLPYLCAGCPHNTSTKVPAGSTARAGIGCHFMANWMDRSTAGLI